MFSFRKSKSSTILLLTLLILASLSNIITVQAAQLTWTVQTVDAAADVGEWTSLAIDSAGNLHASYWDPYWQDLKYAKLTGSTWTIMPVDTVGYIGYLGTSIAVDSTDTPHISYFDHTNGDLKYALWNGLNWSIQTVDSTGSVGPYSSIAIDSNDRPHISYYDHANKGLKYAYWTGSTWNIQTVYPSELAGTASSLDLDSSNRPHIAYWQWNGTHSFLKYVQWTGSMWNFETVQTGVGWEAISLKLDSNDKPHITYFEGVNKNLKYAKKTGSTWNMQIVDASQVVGSQSSLALDSNNNPHIAYSDRYWNDLKYAKLTEYGWFIKNIDNVGDVGRYPSLVLDSTNHPHIVYRDETNKNLKYARDPDETIFSVSYSSFDSDSDSNADSIEAVLDIDTTYSGTLSVFVFGYLEDSLGNSYGFNSTSWQITSNQIELEKITFTLPSDAPEDTYDLYVEVLDDSETIEDTTTLDNIAYLYPSDTNNNGTLTGTVAEFGTLLPMQDIEIYVDETPDIGTYRTLTDSNGLFSIELPEGEHEITAHETEGSMYFDETINVTIIRDSITTQNFYLQRSNWALDVSTFGSGTTSPTPGVTTYPIGSLAEVQAFPETGWHLSYWLLDDTNVGNENPYTLTMDSDHSLKAIFLEEVQIGIFHGTVSDADTAAPIHGAEVKINYATFQTDPAGNFEFELPAGEYEVLVEALDYLSQERQILIEAGEATEENFFLQNIESAQAVIESSNSVGDQKDIFEIGETVYVAGNAYEPSTTYNLYLVEDIITWSNGTTIPTRVPETASTISSNTEGGIPPTIVWSNPQMAGKYDIIVDVNDNGVYDEGLDALDDSDIEVTAGMVIPEFSPLQFISLFIALAIFAVLICRISRQRKTSTHNTKTDSSS